jgi:hypothetical protein
MLLVGAKDGVSPDAKGSSPSGTLRLSVSGDFAAAAENAPASLERKELDPPIKRDVLCGLEKNNIVLFSCHGITDPGWPGRFHLLLTDGRFIVAFGDSMDPTCKSNLTINILSTKTTKKGTT